MTEPQRLTLSGKIVGAATLIGLAVALVTVEDATTKLVFGVLTFVVILGIVWWEYTHHRSKSDRRSAGDPTTKQAAASRPAPQPVPEPVPKPAPQVDEAYAEQLAASVRERVVNRKGSKARLDFFYDLARVEDQHDELYREMIEIYKDDPTYGPVVRAVEEWVNIGYTTLAEWQSTWRNQGTQNQLFNAAYKQLLKGEFYINNGKAFADHITSVVARERRKRDS